MRNSDTVDVVPARPVSPGCSLASCREASERSAVCVHMCSCELTDGVNFDCRSDRRRLRSVRVVHHPSSLIPHPSLTVSIEIMNSIVLQQHVHQLSVAFVSSKPCVLRKKKNSNNI
ncbi:hypothetical protein F2P81_009328 [Scophthalmus maximus]|uniref:Uncharacterized protein n=1 Tax=Scophthalmus maximus TaxID=52904 RepID=A0A6A4T6Q6_SCOMX|nr:hypothetical protein F2P81_009328 [Scophthalmus maximus]